MDILSIVGIVISSIGVVFSLLLFCASVDNGRKILINKVINTINSEVLLMFCEHPFQGNYTQKLKEREKFNQSLWALHRALQEINYISNIIVPQLEVSKSEMITDNKWRNTFDLSQLFISVDEYFKKRHFIGIDFMLEYFDSRLMLCGNYNMEPEYIRRMLIGPIIGVRMQFVRIRERVSYVGNGEETELIKSIKSIKDYKRYYDECYMKFNFNTHIIERKSFKREIKEMIIETDYQMPITTYSL
jgi:hypothetical protein